MKCQICKENNANIIFTKIVNNEKITLNICADCAKEKGLTIKISSAGNPQSETLFEPKPLDFGSRAMRRILRATGLQNVPNRYFSPFLWVIARKY